MIVQGAEQGKVYTAGDILSNIDSTQKLTELIFGSGSTPIGEQIHLSELEKFLETQKDIFLFQNEPPLSYSWQQYTGDAAGSTKHLTYRIETVQRDKYKELAKWTAFRKVGIFQDPPYTLLGPEAYYYGRMDDPTEIALDLAIYATKLSKKPEYQELFSKLKPGQFNLLNLRELCLVDEIIHTSLDDWRSRMLPPAIEYNIDTGRTVDAIPTSLKTIFFAIDSENKLQQAVLVPQLKTVPALRRPDLTQLTPEKLEIYTRFDRLLRGTHPFARSFMRSIEPSV